MGEVDEIKSIEEIKEEAKWQNIDDKTCEEAIKRMSERVSDTSGWISIALKDGKGFKYLQESLGNLYSEFDESSWYHFFLTENADFMSDNLVGKGAVAVRVGSLSQNMQGKYTFFRIYLDTLNKMKPAIDKLRDILAEMYLEKTFEDAIILIGVNKYFKEHYFDENKYNELNTFIGSINNFLKLNMGDLDKRATSSQDYFNRNYADQSEDVFEKGYKDARDEDYKKILVSEHVIGDMMEYNGNGVCNIRDGQYNRWNVIDKSITSVLKIKFGDLKSSMEKVEHLCQEIKNIDLSVDNSRSELSSLSLNLRVLIDVLEQFAKETKTIAEGFEKGDSKAPYCFLNELPALSGSLEYDLSIIKKGGHKGGGSEYTVMFDLIVSSMRKHFEQFMVYNLNVKVDSIG